MTTRKLNDIINQIYNRGIVFENTVLFGLIFGQTTKGAVRLLKKINPTVLKETGYIAIWVLILSAFLQAVFLVAGRWVPALKWDLDVLFGNLLTAAASIGNFFLMGLAVQKAVEKDEKGAKAHMRVSQVYRTLALAAVVAVGVVFFNIWSTIIPVFFPRIAIAFRPLFDKKNDSEKTNGGESA